MTKADIIDSVHGKLSGYSKAEAAKVVEFVFESLKEAVSTQENLKISGFGNFVVHEKAARVGRNPQTREPIEISARRVLTFKASAVLKGRLND